ncbi:MAG: sugar phosphate isomerase/epimerase, partial [Lachnospiraceae bacterium]|nr:sugar phosphate isomerase/epimerase [Lachnospiraceae bacterium]
MLRIAVSSLTYEGFGNTECECLFQNAFRDGYRFVEFNSWYANALTPARIRLLKAGCDESGLTPIALHVAAFGGRTSEAISWNTAHKLRAIEAAAELGCRRVVASGTPDTDSLDALIEELNQIAPYAEQKGVLISLENHCQNILAVSEDYETIFRAVDSRMVGACLDAGHLEAAGETIDHFIDRIGGRINHLHLKENRIFGQKTFCRFGSGGTDNAHMIKRMKEIGYSGYMSVELSPEVGETGESIAFTDADRRKALELYG